MVGLVLVSHSALLAEGVQQVVAQMVQGRVPVALAGGAAHAEEPIGTDPVRVLAAIEAVYSDDGVLILMDLGSAIAGAEAAMELLAPGNRRTSIFVRRRWWRVRWPPPLLPPAAPSIDQVLTEARPAQAVKLAQSAPVLRPSPLESASPATLPLTTMPPDLTQTFLVPNRLGLHARPAARLVATVAEYEAAVTISKGAQVADAASINQLLMLAARQGDTLTVRTTGPEAAAAMRALAVLVADHFGDQDAQAAPTPADGQRAPTTATENEQQLRGIPAATGIAVGQALHLTIAPPTVVQRQITDVRAEQTRLQRAVVAVQRSLAVLEQQMAKRSNSTEADILAAQRLMLADPALLDQVYAAIAAEQANAEWVWQRLITHLAEQYDALDDLYLRRRGADVRDVGEYLLRALLGQPPTPQPLTTPGILVVDELAPSTAAALDPALVLGIVAAHGGANDHSAILARTLGIPAVVGVADALTQLPPGRSLALDGATGIIWLDPDPATVAALTAQRDAALAEPAARQAAARLPAVMQDGTPLTISANVGAVAEIATALAHGADGVGLLRSELLFLAQATLPDEETQVQLYRQALLALAGRPLVVRTLDIGGDKPLPQLDLPPEANPFLGWRGLRYCLDNLDLFRPQLRALLRSAAYGPLKIMFPMVSTVEEVVAAKALIAAEAAQLAAEGQDPGTLPPIGIMVETPAAVFNAAELAQHVAFFSIGTNDLTQYVMAADRGNARVAGLVNALQPPVLQAIAQVVQVAQQAGLPVSVCGEMAADLRATAFFLGLGIRELSMNPGAIPTIKAQIRRLHPTQAMAVAQQLLTLTSLTAVEAYLNRQIEP
ncbi:MAG: phosphoenolpyruvate--protein phosphotransferase [Caldilineaceae bacterium]